MALPFSGGRDRIRWRCCHFARLFARLVGGLGDFFWVKRVSDLSARIASTGCSRGTKNCSTVPGGPPYRTPTLSNSKSPDIGLSVAGCKLLPIMSAKAIRIGRAAAETPKWGIAEICRETPMRDLNPIILLKEHALSAKPRLSVGLESLKRAEREPWENIGYIVLWLCGLSGV